MTIEFDWNTGTGRIGERTVVAVERVGHGRYELLRPHDEWDRTTVRGGRQAATTAAFATFMNVVTCELARGADR